MNIMLDQKMVQPRVPLNMKNTMLVMMKKIVRSKST